MPKTTAPFVQLETCEQKDNYETFPLPCSMAGKTCIVLPTGKNWCWHDPLKSVDHICLT